MTNEELLNVLVLHAIKMKTSDIHLTLRNGISVLEFRTINGLKTIRKFNLSQTLIEYIRFKSNLDLLDSFRPQTSHMMILLNHTTYNIRVAYVRNSSLQSMVMRILNPPNYFKLNTILNNTDYEYVLNQIHHKSGLIIISGTTGSGKTTTLYSILNSIKELKIYTIEDPIEYTYDFLVQLEINNRQNLDFNSSIKQILRHDPNVIVIGEIRDEIEASAAFRCALTGHIVITTIHANSCLYTISRLRDLGVSMSLIKDALKCIIYQDLVVINKQRTVLYDMANKETILKYIENQTF